MKKLSVNLIVKNEEANLTRCLNSIKEIADEIIVVDTGSTDNSVKIAESFQAKIFHFEWHNDFSEARNFALQNSAGDWILYIDADEMLSKDSISELKRIISLPPAAVRCRVKSVGKNLSKNGIMKYPRLFPRDNKLLFEGKIHEQILPSIEKNKIKVIDSSIEIIHFGYDIEPEAMQKKLRRNLEILYRELEENNSVYVHLRLGQTLFALGMYSESERHFSLAALDKSAPGYLRSTVLLHLSLLSSLNNELDDALEYALKGEKLSPQKPYLLYLLMKLNLKKNNQSPAAKYAAKALKANNDMLNGRSDFENETALDQFEILLWNILFAKSNKNFLLAEKLIDELLYISKDRNSSGVRFIKKILKDEKINESEINSALLKYERSAVEPLVEIIKHYPFLEIKYLILYELNSKFLEDSNLLNQLALACIQLARTEEAIIHLDHSLRVDSKNPATYFYLISCYAGNKQIEKIQPIIDDLEINFRNIPQVILRVEALKKRLAQYLLPQD